MTKHPGVDQYETKAGTRWRAWYTLNGKRSSRSFTRLDAARRFRRIYEQYGAERALAAYDRDDVTELVTMTDALERWLSTRTRPSEYTVHTYRRQAMRSWLPHFGNLAVHDLTDEDVAAWVKARRRAGIAESTIEQELSRLRAVLQDCVTRGVITRNPCADIRTKRATGAKRPKVITEEEFYRLLDEIPERRKTLVQVIGETGLRWGEATALQWRNIDFTKGLLSVTRAWKRGGPGAGAQYIGDPKTAAGFRTFTLGGSTLTALSNHYALVDIDPDSLVFPGRTRLGQVTAINHQSFMRHSWEPARERAGLPSWVTPHVLRHAHASWLLARGTPTIVVTRRLGHETTHMTETIYGHWIPDAARLEAEWLGRLGGRDGVSLQLPPAVGS